MTGLTPRLTRLDERVLDALPTDGRSVRVGQLVEALNAGTDPWSSSRTSADEVRAILRGFEHLGRATGRGGWWRAVQTPTEGEPDGR